MEQKVVLENLDPLHDTYSNSRLFDRYESLMLSLSRSQVEFKSLSKGPFTNYSTSVCSPVGYSEM